MLEPFFNEGLSDMEIGVDVYSDDEESQTEVEDHEVPQSPLEDCCDDFNFAYHCLYFLILKNTITVVQAMMLQYALKNAKLIKIPSFPSFAK